jgi:hypothetical protein
LSDLYHRHITKVRASIIAKILSFFTFEIGARNSEPHIPKAKNYSRENSND